MYPRQRNTDTSTTPDPNAPDMPDPHAGWAGVGLVFFWPLGIVALHHASRVTGLWLTGDHAGAHHASERARALGSLALGVWTWAVLVCALVAWSML